MADQALMIADAIGLLNKAIADHDRALSDEYTFRAEHARLALYGEMERWDFVRGARELLRLAETERAPAREPEPAFTPA